MFRICFQKKAATEPEEFPGSDQRKHSELRWRHAMESGAENLRTKLRIGHPEDVKVSEALQEEPQRHATDSQGSLDRNQTDHQHGIRTQADAFVPGEQKLATEAKLGGA
eukprot:CAMPEP_0197703394 /NCGR_PEP_ID=MMETSP1338-20131121/125415_1 /TAXON_ID=43686 ORGANISM="Pelagodinium beii, Strain RCC1491" /NCGR_SAMPLE_ID=MMETSP1338 /ASSEMBLY_ACC=CAM_ASM_000754 /LENGTH=108 /DNA_ID=CAMNT_0043287289 /DNA_START=66 /DNA_END=392 /DNA_ORIENTATION=-